MYDIAKSARAALKSKARRLAEEKDEKVSSADWSPAEPLNADVKTGARPLKRRVYKSGGKVSGDCSPMRADRKPRKSGGRALTANSLVNRDVREANEEREGIKHVGAFKKGGRVGKMNGGSGVGAQQDTKGLPLSDAGKRAGAHGEYHLPKTSNLPKNPPLPPSRPPEKGMTADEAKEILKGRKDGGRAKKAEGGSSKTDMEAVAGMIRDKQRSTRGSYENDGRGPTIEAEYSGKRNIFTRDDLSKAMRKTDEPVQRKSGGRAKKMMGGPMMDARLGMVEPTRMKFSGAQGTPYKKGGKAEHADEAMDKALIKKMVKPEARKKAGGGMLEASKKAMMIAKDPHNQAKIRPQPPQPKPEGKAVGGALTKSGLGGILPMALEGMRGDKDEKAHGDRTARKSGGRTKGKGKTNINIVIATGRGKKDEDQDDMPMPGGRMPIPAPRAAAAPMPGMMPPMAGAAGAPGGMPPMPPGGAGMPSPMPRKNGGRITKVASSYKDMEAGAGSGEGRLQKTDIAAKQPKPGLKRGTIVDDNKGYPNKVNGATGGRTARAAGGQIDQKYAKHLADKGSDFDLMQHMGKAVPGTGSLEEGRKRGGRTARKEGGKVYRSYKDMDAGAGSGKGRLEKTEIEGHKRVR